MIYVLADEDEPSNYNGILPEKQPLNKNYVEASSECNVSEDDVSEDENFAPGTLPYVLR